MTVITRYRCIRAKSVGDALDRGLQTEIRFTFPESHVPNWIFLITAMIFLSTLPRAHAESTPRTYVWTGGVLARRALTWVHVIKTQGDESIVANALSEQLQANDTIRTVRSSTILRGHLDRPYEDVLVASGLFGTTERAVTVLDLVGEYAIVADGWTMYRTDTIRTVKASSLKLKDRTDHTQNCGPEFSVH